jgi:CNT family concentrative nucleoside transporter
MLAGMATIAGTMLVIEAAVISDVVPNATGHLISASLITLPGVVYISHLLEPNTGALTGSEKGIDRGGDSVIDVITKGTQMGLSLFLNIIAMILVIVSLVHLLNAILGLLPDVFAAPLSLERMLGYLLAPLTWLMGIPWAEAVQAGQIMGTKTILTEFIAYIRLGEVAEGVLSPRSRIIMTYALCGFANFVSLGIMIAGLVTMVPERRKEIFGFGMKALVGGTIATCTSACLIGILL